MSARKPDPAIAAWERLQAADKAHSRSWDARDKAEENARAAGFHPLRPLVQIQGNDCIMMADARRAVRGLPKGEAKAWLATMRKAEERSQESRRAVGLAPFDAAERRAQREWRSAMQGMATTRATTTAGVIAKLRIIELELRDGPSGFGEAICASAIADLSRLGKRGR